jgi:Fe2+ or Zn2+ uptake regulation protein
MDIEEKNKYLHIAGIYAKTKSLAETGRQLNLSKERIRQILHAGMEKGVIDYVPAQDRQHEKFATLKMTYPREKIVELLKEHQNIVKAFRIMGVTTHIGKELLALHNITRHDYHLDRFKAKYMAKYMELFEKLGHHPSTTELQAKTENRVLYNALCKYWGGIQQFRAEFGVKKEGHFMNQVGYLKWLKSSQKGKQTAHAKTEQNRKNIISLLYEAGDDFMSRRDFEKALDLSQGTVVNYLQELEKEKLIHSVNLGQQLFYKLDLTNSNYMLYLNQEVIGPGKEAYK